MNEPLARITARLRRLREPRPQAPAPAPSSADAAIRWTTAATVLALGIVAAVVSYQHALDVALDHGQAGLDAHLTPLTIDGLVLAGGLILLACARARRRPPALAYAALALGIGATLAANGFYGAQYGRVGVAVAAWPAVAFVVATELLMKLVRQAGGAGAPAEEGTVGTPADTALDATVHASPAEPVEPGQAVRTTLTAAIESIRLALAGDLSQEKLAGDLGVTRHVIRTLRDLELDTEPAPEAVDDAEPHPRPHLERLEYLLPDGRTLLGSAK